MQEAILPTYKAILRGDRLEWRGTSRQHFPTNRPISVHVTLLDETATLSSMLRSQQIRRYVSSLFSTRQPCRP
jgi:hypothetical protein